MFSGERRLGRLLRTAAAVGFGCALTCRAGVPAVRFQGAINGAASFVFEKDAAVTGWEVEGRASSAEPWRAMKFAKGVYAYNANLGWGGCPLLRVPLKAPAELRVRSLRAGGADGWVDFGRMDPQTGATGLATGEFYRMPYGPDNLTDGNVNTLFEARQVGGWYAQVFSAPVKIRAVRFVGRFGFMGSGSDRIGCSRIECADDEEFASPRCIAEIRDTREDRVNEIVFEKPVIASAFRIVKTTGPVLDILEFQFVPVDGYVPPKPKNDAVFVSPKGSDATGDGSRTKPYKTIARALGRTREKRGFRAIELLDGDCVVAEPIRLSAKDSGLTIRGARGADGADVCIRGDRVLTDWHDDGDGFVAADVPEVKDGRLDSRTLFVNGAFAPRAELPGDGKRFKMLNDPKDLKMRTAMEGFWNRPLTDRETRSLEYDPKDLGPNFDAKNAEIRVFHIWSESLCAVASNVVAESRLWFPKAIPPLGIWKRKDYIVYNTREGMKKPGQWYLDRTRGKVVYWPKPGEDLKKLVISLPLAETLIKVTKASDIRLERLRFCGTTPPVMRAGFAGLDLPAAVEFEGSCPALHLERLTFDHLGGTALKSWNSPKGRMARCKFSDIGCVGVVFQGEASEFVSNEVRRVGVAYPSACGAYAGGKQARVWRNTVTDSPYCGFLICSECRYEENRVMRVMRELSDGAAFYGGCHDSVFCNNIVSDVHTIKGGYGGCAFYCDEGSYGNVYENNVATDVDVPIHMHMGRGQIVRNNLFQSNGRINLSFQGSRDCSFIGNRVYFADSYTLASPDALSVWKDNVFFGPCGSQIEPKPEIPVQPVKAPKVKSVAPGYRFALDRDTEGRIFGPGIVNGDLWWDEQGLHARLQVVHLGSDPVTIGTKWGEGDGVRFTVNGREFVRMATKEKARRPSYNVKLDLAWAELGLEPKEGLAIPFNAEVRNTARNESRWFESPSRATKLTLVK